MSDDDFFGLPEENSASVDEGSERDPFADSDDNAGAAKDSKTSVRGKGTGSRASAANRRTGRDDRDPFRESDDEEGGISGHFEDNASFHSSEFWRDEEEIPDEDEVEEDIQEAPKDDIDELNSSSDGDNKRSSVLVKETPPPLQQHVANNTPGQPLSAGPTDSRQTDDNPGATNEREKIQHHVEQRPLLVPPESSDGPAEEIQEDIHSSSEAETGAGTAGAKLPGPGPGLSYSAFSDQNQNRQLSASFLTHHDHDAQRVPPVSSAREPMPSGSVPVSAPVEDSLVYSEYGGSYFSRAPSQALVSRHPSWISNAPISVSMQPTQNTSTGQHELAHAQREQGRGHTGDGGSFQHQQNTKERAPSPINRPTAPAAHPDRFTLTSTAPPTQQAEAHVGAQYIPASFSFSGIGSGSPLASAPSAYPEHAKPSVPRHSYGFALSECPPPTDSRPTRTQQETHAVPAPTTGTGVQPHTMQEHPHRPQTDTVGGYSSPLFAQAVTPTLNPTDLSGISALVSSVASLTKTLAAAGGAARLHDETLRSREERERSREGSRRCDFPGPLSCSASRWAAESFERREREMEKGRQARALEDVTSGMRRLQEAIQAQQMHIQSLSSVVNSTQRTVSGVSAKRAATSPPPVQPPPVQIIHTTQTPQFWQCPYSPRSAQPFLPPPECPSSAGACSPSPSPQHFHPRPSSGSPRAAASVSSPTRQRPSTYRQIHRRKHEQSFQQKEGAALLSRAMLRMRCPPPRSAVERGLRLRQRIRLGLSRDRKSEETMEKGGHLEANNENREGKNEGNIGPLPPDSRKTCCYSPADESAIPGCCSAPPPLPKGVSLSPFLPPMAELYAERLRPANGKKPFSTRLFCRDFVAQEPSGWSSRSPLPVYADPSGTERAERAAEAREEKRRNAFAEGFKMTALGIPGGGAGAPARLDAFKPPPRSTRNPNLLVPPSPQLAIEFSLGKTALVRGTNLNGLVSESTQKFLAARARRLHLESALLMDKGVWPRDVQADHLASGCEGFECSDCEMNGPVPFMSPLSPQIPLVPPPIRTVGGELEQAVNRSRPETAVLGGRIERGRWSRPTLKKGAVKDVPAPKKLTQLFGKTFS
uniref:Uncharacterized protein n=1 Tax=Chromera velia CCMP2878 TaxID=1169474 RepID=A0A0G4FAW3_9ALVE|eukprot:Cvel_15964.t1-p1 / transcript=Cvel_15964.t1 / gene=Cvel_15964 / organism=Chromera_velia_CCMP2878 / gene_product=hypothetical protein / transcript_product=hypothetical protein / location=Cvel_scaffold1207:41109-46152(-) / protein_length=1101 / sequence_SO=supercontig / SO=protein_coding / is_pseudo=false